MEREKKRFCKHVTNLCPTNKKVRCLVRIVREQKGHGQREGKQRVKTLQGN